MTHTLTPNQIDKINKGRWFTQTIIDKFARKAEITALDKNAHYEMEYHFAVGFEAVLPLIESYIKKRRRSSGKVNENDVTSALQELFGDTYDTFMPNNTNIKPCPLRKPVNKEKKKKTVVNEINYYRNQMDCLYIPKSTFKAIIDSKTFAFTSNPLQWEEDAIDRLQLFMEKTFIYFLKDARLCAIHARRKTVTYKDLELAEYLCRRTYVNQGDGGEEFKRKEREPGYLTGSFIKNIEPVAYPDKI